MNAAEREAVVNTAANAYSHYNAILPGFTIENALSYALEEYEEEIADCSQCEVEVLLKELSALVLQ